MRLNFAYCWDLVCAIFVLGRAYTNPFVTQTFFSLHKTTIDLVRKRFLSFYERALRHSQSHRYNFIFMSVQRSFFLFFFILLVLVACENEITPTVVPTAVIPSVETATESNSTIPNTETTPQLEAAIPPTTVLPTPTPDPLAATVNGYPILLATYERELARYEQAQAELEGSTDTQDYRIIVLNALIEQTLIAQAAEAEGIEITADMVDTQMRDLREAVGGTDNFQAWLESNQWDSEAEFREALHSEMLTEQIVAMVTADVPFAVEQVRARYLQVDDPELAQTLLTQIRNGDDFALRAEQHSLDRVTGQNGGDLGFFARGSLLIPEVEATAFALEPGEVSEIIAITNSNETIYYLVQVIERDPQRPLTADLRYILVQQTFETWLESLRNNADIHVEVDT